MVRLSIDAEAQSAERGMKIATTVRTLELMAGLVTQYGRMEKIAARMISWGSEDG